MLANVLMRSQSQEVLPNLQIFGQPRQLFQGQHSGHPALGYAPHRTAPPPLPLQTPMLALPPPPQKFQDSPSSSGLTETETSDTVVLHVAEQPPKSEALQTVALHVAEQPPKSEALQTVAVQVTPTSLEANLAAMRQHLRPSTSEPQGKNAKPKKQPRAKQPQGRPMKRPAAALVPGGPALVPGGPWGCSKCRWSLRGCARCKGREKKSRGKGREKK